MLLNIVSNVSVTHVIGTAAIKYLQNYSTSNTVYILTNLGCVDSNMLY